MKLCTFSRREVVAHVGVQCGNGELVDVTEAFAGDARFASLQSLIEHEATTLGAISALLNSPERLRVAHRLRIDEVTLGIPLEPPQIRCFSVYEQHLKNAFGQVIRHELNPLVAALVRGLGLMRIPRGFYETPAYYKGARLNLGGHRDRVPRPRPGSRLDYEAELGVVIGRPGKDIDPANAMDHVFGYVVFNDFSERAQLIKEMRSRPSAGPAKGKDFDRSNCIGPWVVTRDEVPNPRQLPVTVRVNGKTVGTGSTAGMTHGVERIVAYASWSETLHPGELLATGCVPNCAGIERWQFLDDGDRVEVEIGHLGTLQNTIAPVGG